MAVCVLIQLIMVQTGSVFDCLGAGEAVRGAGLVDSTVRAGFGLGAALLAVLMTSVVVVAAGCILGAGIYGFLMVL